MIGVMIVTHGKLAEGFKDALSVIVGDTADIKTLGLFPGDSVEEFGNKIHDELVKCESLDGVIIFADLVSASPYNQSMIAINKLPEEMRKKCYLIGGVNFPMIIETVNHQILDSEIEVAVKSICEQGSMETVAWTYSENTNSDNESDDF